MTNKIFKAAQKIMKDTLADLAKKGVGDMVEALESLPGHNALKNLIKFCYSQDKLDKLKGD